MNVTSWLQGLRAVKTQEGLHALGARLPRYVSIALALALAAQAAVIVTDFAGSFHPPSSARLAGPAPAPGSGRHTLDIPALANAHLFGTAPAPGASSAEDGQAPATRLALVLAGVLAADDPAHGLAILGEAVSNARVYAVGQNVPGGARLHAVYDDRVILDRDGAFESLALPRGGAAAGARGRPAPLLGQAPVANPLETMRRVINDNPGVVGEIFRPTAVFTNGKQEGFRVYPGRNRAAFSHLGLQPGDLVTAVNGTPLDDPARGNEILGTLSSSAEARVTVTRNGRSQDLVLNLAQVAAEAEQTLGTPAARASELPMAPGPGPVSGSPAAETPAPSPEPAANSAANAAATPTPAATAPGPEAAAATVTAQ